VGRNWIERAAGGVSELQGCDETLCQPGDVFVIQTPTGGAFGKKS
jgi:5-oxoprolinase (ATP-hydrolysing)